jgi:hypothetical protein
MLGGYDVKGVISHDVTLPDTHPGHNDHHQIHGTPAPAPLEVPGSAMHGF